MNAVLHHAYRHRNGVVEVCYDHTHWQTIHPCEYEGEAASHRLMAKIHLHQGDEESALCREQYGRDLLDAIRQSIEWGGK